MNSRPMLSVFLAVVPTFISVIVYVILGMICIAPASFGLEGFFVEAFGAPNAMIGVGIMSFLIAIAALVIAGAFIANARWSWYAMFGLAVLYTPSAFFMLGIPMVIAVLNEDVQLAMTGKLVIQRNKG